MSGFAGAASLTARGLPRGSKWAFSPKAATTGSTLRIGVSSSTQRGLHTFAVIAAGSGVTRSVKLSLKVMR